MNIKAFKNFLRVLKIEEKNGIDKNVLKELKNWGKEKLLKNDEIINEYLIYKNVLNDYTQILQENKAENKKCEIEKVANYVGLTTNYTR
ncbi:conserved Plasmodium protein, unknown function [Plasmodium relictum]|uniref:Uncharacterized protein n=1 Tax=Plasmodium relictum TaxID=85471 RepID=A0A1J1HBM8_PLARL|nr:conserved Plasmodium protein, unknown function [Plasmodium relictum]CRH02905.1 conserved Plasmodium protein, unknown function [Plasmodium relictum]